MFLHRNSCLVHRLVGDEAEPPEKWAILETSTRRNPRLIEAGKLENSRKNERKAALRGRRHLGVLKNHNLRQIEGLRISTFSIGGHGSEPGNRRRAPGGLGAARAPSRD